MRRFKVSKYKNAAPKPGKNDPWIRDISVGSYGGCSGNLIKASAAYAAFNINPTGSQLGIAPIGVPANGSSYSILNAHSDLVTDLDFSPFEDNLLATCSGDSTVKIWSLDQDKDISALSPELIHSNSSHRIESVRFNPTIEYLLLYSSSNCLTFLDILHNKKICQLEGDIHEDTILGIDWSYHNGSLVGTTCKDKKVRVIDPRSSAAVVNSAISHENPKDSRILFCGENHILTTGFDTTRMRQIFIRDLRNFSAPVVKLNFDSSTGILIPLFDPDTNMIFIAGRGDSSISYYEFSTNTSSSGPILSDGFRYSGDQTTRGACLGSKRSLRVMDTEINRIYQLTSNSIYSISYHVPRKSYLDFHDDLFPTTRGTSTTGHASLWMDGSNGIVSKISLNPKKIGSGLITFKPSLSSRKKEDEAQTEAFGKSGLTAPEAQPLPLPRKKSLTPSTSGSGSSSTEDISAIGKPVPTPKPRIVSNFTAGTSSGAGTALRTPSSFLPTRRASDLSGYGSSGSASGPDSMPEPEVVEAGQNNNNGNGRAEDADPENEPESLPEEPINQENGNEIKTTLATATNENEDPDYAPENSRSPPVFTSTSDRLKQFEMKMNQNQQQNLNSNSGTGIMNEEIEKVRLTVADRFKIFQRNSSIENESSSSLSEVEKSQSGPKPKVVTETDENCITTTSHQPPFPKPERKITPPSASPSNSNTDPKPKTKRIETVFGKISKFRNFKALPVHKQFHIENLRNISTTCPSESELIQANPVRVAVPLNTPGGKLAIFELDSPGRLADGVIPALVHGSKICCFDFDPFDNSHLIVGTDDGKLVGWKIPPGGLKEQTNDSEYNFYGHAEKLYFLKFNPLAKNVLASGSYDLTIRIWDLEKREDLIILHLQPAIVQIFSFAWSPTGSKFCIGSKDGMLRVYEPRDSLEPLVEGKGPPGVRGGRVIWVLDGKCIVVSGFDRSSERQVIMYRSNNLEQIASVSLDVSPSILVPHYDEDSSLLLLSGRGDSTIFTFDVIDENPYLRQLSSHRFNGPHQGISFLKKNALDIKGVEFAKCLRLTESAVEPWSFTVPRVKSQFFQDDLFPETKVLWEPSMTAEEWFEGKNIPPKKISLKPEGMKSVAEVGSGKSSTTIVSKSETESKIKPISREKIPAPVLMGPNFTDLTDKEKQKNLEESWKTKMPLNLDLEQDEFEGVSEEEWN